jgi:hypothetical protein
MAISFINEWIEQVRPLFPDNAKIELDEGNDIILRIDWKLQSDPTRPNKRSRLIRVVIPEEAIEDCPDLHEAGTRFAKIIKDKLRLFKADHDTPKHGKHGRTPVEEWIVSSL